ncbi:MAG: TadE family protein [Gaiellales bacterium]
MALVEFALFLPLLVMLCLGTVDFGRAFMTWNQVKNAAREGAAFAQTHPGYQKNPSGTDLCDGLNNIESQALKETGGSSAGFTVTVTPAETSSGGCDPTGPPVASGGNITVEVNKQMTLITPFMSTLIGHPIITGEITMVVQ